MNIYIRLLLYCLFAATSLIAQQSGSGVPQMIASQQYELLPVVDMPEFSINDFVRTENASFPGNTKSQLAGKCFSTNIDFNNSGTWRNEKGLNIWGVRIRSRNAKALGLVFESFQLRNGEKLFIYNANDIEGALTLVNNTPDSVLAIRTLPGDILTIEFSTPYKPETCGSFNITKVAHEFLQEPGGCNININCTFGTKWQTEKRSVVKMTIYKSSGMYYCTGVMVNNTNFDSKPYVLTANHCVCTEYEGNHTVFNFMYESADCASNVAINNFSISSSKVLSTYYEYDFSLLELPYKPPMAFKPYYAGWSVEDNGNMNKVVSIHHPWGAVTKICYDNEHPTVSTFEDAPNPPYAPNAFWQIASWDGGVTENGSSGGPLFDENNRIIGTLTGGYAVCGNPVLDYFARFNVYYASLPESSRQLKYWLDPINSGVSHLDGFNPFPTPFSICDTLNNIQASETASAINYEYGTGSYSGTNSDSITEYAEKFEYADTLYLSGLLMNIAAKSSTGGFELQIYEGTEFPEKVIFEKYVPYNKLNPKGISYIDIYPTVTSKGNLFVAYHLNYTLNDTFGLNIAPPRPINSFNSAFLKLNGIWQRYSSYTKSAWGTSLGIELIACRTLQDKVEVTHQQEKLKAFPNPATQFVSIQIPNNEIVVSLLCVSTDGKHIPVTFLKQNGSILLNLNHVQEGIYSVRMLTNKGAYFAKILITR